MLVPELEHVESFIFEELINQNSELSTENISRDFRLSADLGLTSLDLARLIAILESKLRVDPFLSIVPITSIRTVGDLIDAYKACFDDQLKHDKQNNIKHILNARISASRDNKGK